jgi:hypothetical protein
MTGYAAETMVKQYVAVVQGQYGKFMVFETGSARHYLFAQLAPDGTQTGLSWPVLKSDLRPEIRSMLRHGCGNAGLP